MLTILGIVFTIIAVAAVVMSFRIMKKQANKAWSAGDVDKNVLNHPFGFNPIIIFYWISPFVMIIGALILGYYYHWGVGE